MEGDTNWSNEEALWNTFKQRLQEEEENKEFSRSVSEGQRTSEFEREVEEE